METKRPDFTEDQLHAIEYKSLDVCVVAGPGSGKTTVLVERYRQLLEVHHLGTHQILAITFTDKAAANMRAKLAKLFDHDADRKRDLESASWVSTIHGFCMRLLRENAIVAGLDPRFAILSPRESDRMQWECLQTALDEMTDQRRAETLELIEALHSPRLTEELKSVYDGIRSAGLSIDEVREMPNPDAAAGTPGNIAGELRGIVESYPFIITPTQRTEKARLLEWCETFDSAPPATLTTWLTAIESLDLNLNRIPKDFRDQIRVFRERLELETSAAVDRDVERFRAMVFDVLARFDEDYRNRKTAQARVDFNDLERLSIALLRNNPEIRERVQKQFRQVMLDEYQDINGQQAALIDLLRSEGVFFGVGDRNQSIYGFRHARPGIFQGYQADVSARNAQLVDLRHNFRSREAILRCVGVLLNGQEGIDPRELIQGNTFAAKDEPCVEVLKVGDPADDKLAAGTREADWIAHRVRTLRGTLQLGAPGKTRAADFHDFAVLCRSGDSMTPILEAFDRAGIPYVCGRRPSFLLSRTGRDITALLKVIANPRDSISLATLLRGPFVSLSDEGLLRLRLFGGSLTSGVNKFSHAMEPSGLAPEDAAKTAAFCRHLNRWRSDQPIVPLDVLLSRALSDCGFHWTPVTSIGGDVESFLHLARTTGAAMDLTAFLREVESLSAAAGMESELSDEDQGNCVQVMTAHAAKGLEFNITIVAAMDKGPRRESGPVTFTPEHGVGLKWRNPLADDGKDELKDSWSEANKKVASAREKAEENRLLYVAMTRASEHLILSYTWSRTRPSNWAGLVDAYFQLHGVAPSPEFRREERDGFAASVLVTNADPPYGTQADRDAAEAQVLTIPKPVIEDQHDSSVAVTSLAVFGSCPRKYYIQRSLGWNSGRFRRFDPDHISADADTDDSGGDPGAARVGTAVHEILAGLPPEDDSPEARRLAEVFRKGDLGRRVAAAQRVEREWTFEAEMDGTIVRGTIDLWFEEKGELHVVDYKTDEIARPDDYSAQLALYAIALERAIGIRPRTAWLHFLRPNIIVEIALDDQNIATARALIAALRVAQDTLRFPLHEADHCRTCAFYKTLCPAGRQNSIDEHAVAKENVAY